MDASKKEEEKKVGLAFLPLPGISHLVSMVEFVKHLLHHHHNKFSITILTIPPLEPSPQISSYISSVVATGLSVSFYELPKMDPSMFKDATSIASTSIILDFQKPHIISAIDSFLSSSPSTPIAAIIVDMFCIDFIDVANDIGIPFYIFFTSSATSLGLMLYLPTIDDILPIDKDMYELQEEGSTTIHLPGIANPLPPITMPDPFYHRKGQGNLWTWLLRTTRRYPEVKGFIVNTYSELQPSVMKALAEGSYLPNHPTPPVYPVGPLLSIKTTSPSSEGQRHECLRWLDDQPPKSVVFLCFGSMGSFTANQAREIAVGLEGSGQRFLWVLRSPPKEQGSRTPVDAVLDEVLPPGFLERTREKGMVWPTFAPQAEILGHMAVGGFVTHCGWNSCLESLWFGMPMLTWPLYAEQRSNAFEMVREMGVAMELKMNVKEGNWVTAEEVERGVRCLMEEGCSEESMKVRSMAMEMREKGRRALEEGGSSVLSMERLAETLISDVSRQHN